MTYLASLIEDVVRQNAIADEAAAWADEDYIGIDWDFEPEPIALASEPVEW